MRAAALALLLLAALAAPAGAQDVRLRGLDTVDALFGAEPSALLAGDRAVVAGTAGVFEQPLTGGRPRKLAALPELGPAENDVLDGGGFVRVEASEAGRIALASGGGSSLTPEADDVRRPVLVGPPTGPFDDPAPCGERSHRPAALSGDLVAYLATSEPGVRCAGGEPVPVTGPAVVVRDVAAGGALVTSVPVPSRARVRAVQLRTGAPGAVAVELLVRRPPVDEDEDVPSRVHVQALDGRPLTVTKPVSGPFWTLGEDGTLVSAGQRVRSSLPCVAPGVDPRVHPPGDAAGRPLGEAICAEGSMRIDAGHLRLSARRPDGRLDLVDRDLATGGRQVLATVAGVLLDADDRTLLATDETCASSDVRVLPARPAALTPAAGPRRCPIEVTVPRSAGGARGIPVRMRCPRGCRVEVETTYRFAGTDVSGGGGGDAAFIRPGRARKVRLGVGRYRGRFPRAVRVAVTVRQPVGHLRQVVRRIRPGSARRP